MNNDTSSAELMDYAFDRQTGSRGRKSNTAVGIVVLLLALFGLVSLVITIVGTAKKENDKKMISDINAYNAFLIPVAAADPSAFEDVGTASMSEMIEIAVWSIIGRNLDPNDYDYSSGNLALPVQMIEQAYTRYFGTQVPIVHQTVEGYGYRFEYSEDNACYFIPLTGISPVYTPSVQSVEDRNGVITVTCGLIYSGAWQQNYETGEFERPDPDKYITVTIRNQSGADYISAIGTTGKTVS